MKKPPEGGCTIFWRLIFTTIYLGKKSITVFIENTKAN